MGGANSTTNDLMHLNANNADNKSNQLSLDKRVNMLNVDRRRIFENVKSHLVHQNNTKLVYATVITNHFVCLLVALEVQVSIF